MNLSLLHAIADERQVIWNEAGATWELIDGPLTDKPAAWLILTNDDVMGQLTVWVSGEAELDWGTEDRGGQRHYDLDSPEPYVRASRISNTPLDWARVPPLVGRPNLAAARADAALCRR